MKDENRFVEFLISYMNDNPDSVVPADEEQIIRITKLVDGVVLEDIKP